MRMLIRAECLRVGDSWTYEGAKICATGFRVPEDPAAMRVIVQDVKTTQTRCIFLFKVNLLFVDRPNQC